MDQLIHLLKVTMKHLIKHLGIGSEAVFSCIGDRSTSLTMTIQFYLLITVLGSART